MSGDRWPAPQVPHMSMGELRTQIKIDQDLRFELLDAVNGVLSRRSKTHQQTTCAVRGRIFEIVQPSGRWLKRGQIKSVFEIHARGKLGNEVVSGPVAYLRQDGRLLAFDEKHLLTLPVTTAEEAGKWRSPGWKMPVDQDRAWLFGKCKDVLRVSHRELAYLLDIGDGRRMRRFMIGDMHIPPEVWPKLRTMLRARNVVQCNEVAAEIEEKVMHMAPPPPPPKRWEPPKPPIGPDGKPLRFTWAENQMITAYAKKRQMANLRDGQWGENPMPSFVQGQVARQLRELGQDAIVAEFEGREPPRDHPASPVLTAAQIRDRLSR